MHTSSVRRIVGGTAAVMLLALVGATLALAANVRASADTIKIGVIVPLSGTYASAGQEVFRGYELAVAKFGGKVAGKKIQLVRGDAFTPDSAIAETTRLATQENVDMFVGTYATPTSQAGSETAARYNKIWWETHAITDSLTLRGLPNYLRSGARAQDFAKASVEFVKNVLEPRLGKNLKVFVDHESGLYGTSVAATQSYKLKAYGYNTTIAKHASAATDVTDSVLAAKRANPDVWLLTGYVPDLNLLLRAAASQGFKPRATVLVGTGDGRETYEAVGAKDLTNTFVVAYSTPLSKKSYAPGIAELFTAYKKKYEGEPIGTVATTGYSGMTAALKALEAAKGKTDVESVRKAALGLKIPFTGLPNGWGVKFTDKGQNIRIRLVVIQWRSNGTTPAIYPPQARLSNQSIQGLK
jgi:branched-chain amino acid transport system substrate-binding protein